MRHKNVNVMVQMNVQFCFLVCFQWQATRNIAKLRLKSLLLVTSQWKSKSCQATLHTIESYNWWKRNFTSHFYCLEATENDFHACFDFGHLISTLNTTVLYYQYPMPEQFWNFTFVSPSSKFSKSQEGKIDKTFYFQCRF